jgi:uncharacterized protein YutE (UPF0331/DUF86 family)
MIDKVLLRSKLKKIEEFVKELKSREKISFEDFQKNVVLKRFVERNLELAIQQMIDICKHIVSRLNLREPISYADCFEILVEEGYLSEDNLEKYKNMARFRNLLIHIYEKVTDKIVYEIFQKNLEDFELFVDEVKRAFKL